MQRFRVYSEVQGAYDAMLAAIRGAEHEILLEQYVLEDLYPEGIGGEFIQALLERARAGVRVFLYLDATGSLEFFVSTGLNKKLADAGVHVSYYKTFSMSFYKSLSKYILINPFSGIIRNHRKILAIDSHQVWIGGVIIGDTYRSWNDLLVEINDSEIVKSIITHLHDVTTKRGLSLHWIKPMIANPETKTQILTNAPGFGAREISNEIYRRIKHAKKSIEIVTPYFTPPAFTWIQIKKAIERGVQVRLIIPEKTDVNFLNKVHRGFFDVLLKKSIEIYRHENMIHAKVVRVDDWVTFGSCNFDSLSFIFNHELNIATEDKELVPMIKQYIVERKEYATRLEPGDLKATVKEKISIWLHKLLRIIA